MTKRRAKTNDKPNSKGKRSSYGPEMEGEGNKSADRHYRAAAEKHANSPENRRAAKRAARALDTDEARDLDEARERSKAHEPDGRH